MQISDGHFKPIGSLSRIGFLGLPMVIMVAALMMLDATLLLADQNQAAVSHGKLVIVGGGGTPKEVIQQTIKLAGGKKAQIVVIPTASTRREAGNELKKFFESFGAKHVEVLQVRNRKQAREQLDQADLIWMGGGNQNRLVKTLTPTLVKKIRTCFERGCIVGGTSAGAAAMSQKMITGQADLTSVTAKSTELVDGIGLTDLIIDQHFHQRQRFNRLLSAVLDNPENVGIGIDEKTAIIVDGSKIRVLGMSNVLVIDARQSRIASTKAGTPHDALNVKVHVVEAGKSIDLSKRRDAIASEKKAAEGDEK